MNYEQVLTYLYERLPMFQKVGKSAFKKDLSNTIRLLDLIGNPHHGFKSIHIAGTNGKGSSAHALASILQRAGYKTGLYTSPHLKSFTERVRLNGTEIPTDYVANFVTRHQAHIETINPSFFEVTVALAFQYFADCKVDLAVIETGLGGRLDSTNVIVPELSLITMIGMDHADLLGDTLESIAAEKAGIIKANVPVVIGANQPDLRPVFNEKAKEVGTKAHFAEAECVVTKETLHGQVFDLMVDGKTTLSQIPTDITARYFLNNVPGIYECVSLLNQMGYRITDEAFVRGLQQIKNTTGLKGRWQMISEHPLLIADVSHNEAGMALLAKQLKAYTKGSLHIVMGMVRDKDVSSVLSLLPVAASYYFTQSSVPRSMTAMDLAQQAEQHGLIGSVHEEVNEAMDVAMKNASTNDLILVCGSTFVVAEIKGL